MLFYNSVASVVAKNFLVFAFYFFLSLISFPTAAEVMFAFTLVLGLYA